MYSQIVRCGKRFLPLASSILLLAAAPSCTRNVPHVAKPPIVAVPSPPAPIAIPAQPKHVGPLPPIAFPDLTTGQIRGLHFSPDGRRLAFGYGTDAEISMWNLETGRLDWQRYVDGANGGPILMDPNGQFMVVQCYDPDNTLPIWICDRHGHLHKKLPNYLGADCRLERKNQFLVFGAFKQRQQNDYTHGFTLTEVYSTHTWRQTDEEKGYPKWPVRLTASGKIIPPPKSASRTQRSFEPPKPPDQLSAISYGNYFIRLSGDNGSKGRIEVWDTRRRVKLCEAYSNGECPYVSVVSPNGQTLAVSTSGGNIILRKLKTGTLIGRTHCADDIICCLAFSPNGRVLAAAGDWQYQGDGIRLLDCSTNHLLAVLKVASPDNYGQSQGKNWSLNHPDWFAVLPDLSYVANDSVIQRIRMPGKTRDAAVIRKFERPRRVRAALRKCYSPC